jgi:replication factor C subunit 1
MRMKVSGDKTEIRRYYLPALFPHVIEPFADKDRDKAVGDPVALLRISTRRQEVIKEVIDVMDEYYLNKEDWETLVELGVGDRNETEVLKRIPTATKTAFTKAYVLLGLFFAAYSHPLHSATTPVSIP